MPPRVPGAVVLRAPADTAGVGQFAAIQAVAPSLGVELSPVDVRDTVEMERAVAAFARSANGGLIVTASAAAGAHPKLIIALAAPDPPPPAHAPPPQVTRRRPIHLR